MNESAATGTASDFVTVRDADGINGFISRAELTAATPDSHIAVQLNKDQRIFIPSNLLQLQQTGTDSYAVSYRFAEIETSARGTVNQSNSNVNSMVDDETPLRPETANTIDASSANASVPEVDDEFLVVPVLAETLQVDKREVEAGRVRVTKTVQERTETIEAPVMVEEVSVERVTVNRQVESAPPVRYEGDAMIVSLVEEVVVVEKRLMLREELRITKQRTEKHDRREVTLRSEQATVERIETNNEDAPQPS